MGVWSNAADRIRRLLKNKDVLRLASEENLRQFLAAIQASPNGVLVLDPEWRITWCNTKAAQLLGIDPVRDLAPVSQLTSLPNILVVHPSLPVKSVKELIAFVKARPGQLNFGSSGVATGTHLSMELFMHMTGLKMVHIPYKGGSLNVNALIAGETQVNFSTISTALQHVKTGRLRALAVSTAKRAAAAPDIPTVNEAGLKGYEVTIWNGFFAPKGTSKEIVAKLNGALVAALSSGDFKNAEETLRRHIRHACLRLLRHLEINEPSL